MEPNDNHPLQFAKAVFPFELWMCRSDTFTVVAISSQILPNPAPYT